MCDSIVNNVVDLSRFILKHLELEISISSSLKLTLHQSREYKASKCERRIILGSSYGGFTLFQIDDRRRNFVFMNNFAVVHLIIERQLKVHEHNLFWVLMLINGKLLGGVELSRGQVIRVQYYK